MRKLKARNKILKAVITSLIFVVLYFGFLYLPTTVFKAALVFAVLGFLASLYFDPDYRFFKIALLLIGLFGVNSSIPAFNLSLNSDNYFLSILKQKEPFSANNLSLFFGGLFCLLLDFLREDSASRHFISIIGIGNTVNHTIHHHHELDTEELVEKLTQKIETRNGDHENEYIRSLEETIEDLKKNKQEDALQFLEKGNVDEAEKLLIQYANEEANKSSEAWVNVGNIAYLNDSRRARAYFKRAVEVDPQNGNAHYQLGHLYRRVGEYPAAKIAYESALGLEENAFLKVIIYENIGVVYQFMGELDKAVEIYEKCLDLNKEFGHKESLANNYGNIGNIYQIKGDLRQAVEMYQEGIKLYDPLGCEKNVAKLYGQLGNISLLQNNHDDALEMYQRSIDINETLGLKESLAFQYGNIGIVYAEIGEIDKALEVFDLSIKINTELDHQAGLASNFINKANVYEDMGEFNKSLSLNQDSMKINKKLDNKIGIADNYQNIGSTYESMDDLDKAITMYRKSLNINEKMGRKIGMANNYGKIGDIYQHYGDLNEAVKNWEKSKLLFESAGAISIAEVVENLIQDVESNQQ